MSAESINDFNSFQSHRQMLCRAISFFSSKARTLIVDTKMRSASVEVLKEKIRIITILMEKNDESTNVSCCILDEIREHNLAIKNNTAMIDECISMLVTLKLQLMHNIQSNIDRATASSDTEPNVALRTFDDSHLFKNLDPHGLNYARRNCTLTLRHVQDSPEREQIDDEVNIVFGN